MGIGKRIKQARENIGLTQKELGELIGVTSSAITNYENETSHPKEPIMYALINALHVDANFLFQDCVLNQDILITLSERKHIKKYRTLDEYGKKAVDAVLNIEFERCEHKTECQDTKSQQKNCAAARDGQRIQINPVENLEDLLSEDTYDK